MNRSAIALVASACVLSACAGNPLTGRWTNSQQYPPPSVSPMPGTLTTVVDFGADNSFAMTITGSAGCTGEVRLSNYRVSLNASSATSGTYQATTLGTCTGSGVQCPFGGMNITVAQCGGAGTAGVAAMAASYVLSADGRTLSLNGQVYSRVN